MQPGAVPPGMQPPGDGPQQSFGGMGRPHLGMTENHSASAGAFSSVFESAWAIPPTATSTMPAAGGGGLQGSGGSGFAKKPSMEPLQGAPPPGYDGIRGHAVGMPLIPFKNDFSGRSVAGLPPAIDKASHHNGGPSVRSRPMAFAPTASSQHGGSTASPSFRSGYGAAGIAGLVGAGGNNAQRQSQQPHNVNAFIASSCGSGAGSDYAALSQTHGMSAACGMQLGGTRGDGHTQQPASQSQTLRPPGLSPYGSPSDQTQLQSNAFITHGGNPVGCSRFMGNSKTTESLMNQHSAGSSSSSQPQATSGTGNYYQQPPLAIRPTPEGGRLTMPSASMGAGHNAPGTFPGMSSSRASIQTANPDCGNVSGAIIAQQLGMPHRQQPSPARIGSQQSTSSFTGAPTSQTGGSGTASATGAPTGSTPGGSNNGPAAFLNARLPPNAAMAAYHPSAAAFRQPQAAFYNPAAYQQSAAAAAAYQQSMAMVYNPAAYMMGMFPGHPGAYPADPSLIMAMPPGAGRPNSALLSAASAHLGAAGMGGGGVRSTRRPPPRSSGGNCGPRGQLLPGSTTASPASGALPRPLNAAGGSHHGGNKATSHSRRGNNGGSSRSGGGGADDDWDDDFEEGDDDGDDEYNPGGSRSKSSKYAAAARGLRPPSTRRAAIAARQARAAALAAESAAEAADQQAVYGVAPVITATDNGGITAIRSRRAGGGDDSSVAAFRIATTPNGAFLEGAGVTALSGGTTVGAPAPKRRRVKRSVLDDEDADWVADGGSSDDDEVWTSEMSGSEIGLGVAGRTLATRTSARSRPNRPVVITPGSVPGESSVAQSPLGPSGTSNSQVAVPSGGGSVVSSAVGNRMGARQGGGSSSAVAIGGDEYLDDCDDDALTTTSHRRKEAETCVLDHPTAGDPPFWGVDKVVGHRDVYVDPVSGEELAEIWVPSLLGGSSQPPPSSVAGRNDGGTSSKSTSRSASPVGKNEVAGGGEGAARESEDEMKSMSDKSGFKKEALDLDRTAATANKDQEFGNASLPLLLATDPPPNDSAVLVRKYIIKWQGLSHLHNTAYVVEDLEYLRVQGIKKVTNYIKKQADFEQKKLILSEDEIEQMIIAMELQRQLDQDAQVAERIVTKARVPAPPQYETVSVTEDGPNAVATMEEAKTGQEIATDKTGTPGEATTSEPAPDAALPAPGSVVPGSVAASQSRASRMQLKRPEDNKMVDVYLVKWISTPYDQCTWETEDFLRLHGFGHLIQEYEDRENRICGPLSSEHPLNQHDLSETSFEPYTQTPPYLAPGMQLRDYQLTGVNWIISRLKKDFSVLLADEMGLGKTAQTIVVIGHMVYVEKVAGPFLVVVPQSTMDNWLQEFKRWLPHLNVVLHHGNPAARQIVRRQEMQIVQAQSMSRPAFSSFIHPRGKLTSMSTQNLKQVITHRVRYRADVVITTTSILQCPDDLSYLKSIPWYFMAVDEAHQLKNRESKRFKELCQFRPRYKLLLSGTPLHNNLEELWSLLYFMNPSHHPSLPFFLQQYSEVERTDSVGEQKTRQLQMLDQDLRAVVLRRVKKDVLRSLPNKVEWILRVELSPVQASLCKDVVLRNYESLQKSTGGSKLSLQNICVELKKICNHPFLLHAPAEREAFQRDLLWSSGKMCLMDKLLVRLKEKGHRVLIFSQMVKMLNLLSTFLTIKGYKHQRLDGTMSRDVRRKAMDHFNAPNSEDFCFLLSTKAGGLGINLTSADTVIIYDSDWNPQNDLQAEARAHRIGQTKTVQIYRIVTKDSVEEDILERAKAKMVLDALVVQGLNVKAGVADSDLLCAAGGASGQSKGGTSGGFNREELTKILMFGARKLWGRNGQQQDGGGVAGTVAGSGACGQEVDGRVATTSEAQPEIDLDKVLAEAEQKQESSEGRAADLLSSFSNVSDFRYEAPKAKEEDKFEWDAIVPLEERAKFNKKIVEANSTPETRSRKAVGGGSAPASFRSSKRHSRIPGRDLLLAAGGGGGRGGDDGDDFRMDDVSEEEDDDDSSDAPVGARRRRGAAIGATSLRLRNKGKATGSSRISRTSAATAAKKLGASPLSNSRHAVGQHDKSGPVGSVAGTGLTGVAGGLTDKERYRLSRAIIKFGMPTMRYQDVVEDAKLQRVPVAEVGREADELLTRCKQTLTTTSEGSGHGATDTGSGITGTTAMGQTTGDGASSTGSKGKTAVKSLALKGGYSCPCKEFVDRVQHLEALHALVEAQNPGVREPWTLDSSQLKLTLPECALVKPGDASLLRGIYLHGFANWQKIATDEALAEGVADFAKKIKSDKIKSRATRLLQFVVSLSSNSNESQNDQAGTIKLGGSHKECNSAATGVLAMSAGSSQPSTSPARQQGTIPRKHQGPRTSVSSSNQIAKNTNQNPRQSTSAPGHRSAGSSRRQSAAAPQQQSSPVLASSPAILPPGPSDTDYLGSPVGHPPADAVVAAPFGFVTGPPTTSSSLPGSNPQEPAGGVSLLPTESPGSAPPGPFDVLPGDLAESMMDSVVFGTASAGESFDPMAGGLLDGTPSIISHSPISRAGLFRNAVLVAGSPNNETATALAPDVAASGEPMAVPTGATTDVTDDSLVFGDPLTNPTPATAADIMSGTPFGDDDEEEGGIPDELEDETAGLLGDGPGSAAGAAGPRTLHGTPGRGNGRTDLFAA